MLSRRQNLCCCSAALQGKWDDDVIYVHSQLSQLTPLPPPPPNSSSPAWHFYRALGSPLHPLVEFRRVVRPHTKCFPPWVSFFTYATVNQEAHRAYPTKKHSSVRELNLGLSAVTLSTLIDYTTDATGSKHLPCLAFTFFLFPNRASGKP